MGWLNRGKKGRTLKLRAGEGKEIFRELVKISDVVVENFSATTMKRLGFDYAALKEINPRIVYTSVSGFGHDDIYPGPYTDRPAFNLIAQAMSGLMDITGEADGPPVPNGVARSEEHTSELQSLMRISYAVFCLKKKKTKTRYT